MAADGTATISGSGAAGRIHIIGIGGAGMSAIARLLAGRGREVSGSDLRASEAVARLVDGGLAVWSGHDPARVEGSSLVVASSAVPDDDPEILAARRLGIPVWRRPQLLGELTAGIPTIGPTGTHGKTTSAAMMTVALRAAGVDPSFIVGGEIVDLRTNAGVGTDDLLVLEADEAFGTFEHLHLAGLMVTNVEAEHLDHYRDVDSLEAAFIRVAGGVDGPVVACADDAGSTRVGRAVGSGLYGLSEDSEWRVVGLTASPGGVAFTIVHAGFEIPVSIPRPGVHVAQNGAGVIALLAARGFDPERVAAGLSTFHGVRRRFEHRGTVAGVTVIDDYAHHPTEVAATLSAARSLGGRRVWAVFQPHLYSRTVAMAADFGVALAIADRVVVTDVYGARERPVPGVTGHLVARAAEAAGADTVYVAHRSEVAPFLAESVAAGDVVVTMGAGDITVVPGELLVLLTARGAA